MSPNGPNPPPNPSKPPAAAPSTPAWPNMSYAAAALPVRQDAVRLVQLLEALLGAVVLVDVGVVLLREAPERPLDLGVVGVARHTEHVVVVALHGHSVADHTNWHSVAASASTCGHPRLRLSTAIPAKPRQVPAATIEAMTTRCAISADHARRFLVTPPPPGSATLPHGGAGIGPRGRRAARPAPVRPARGARGAQPRPRAPRPDQGLSARVVRAVAVRRGPAPDRALQQEPQPGADARAAALPHHVAAE